LDNLATFLKSPWQKSARDVGDVTRCTILVTHVLSQFPQENCLSKPWLAVCNGQLETVEMEIGNRKSVENGNSQILMYMYTVNYGKTFN